MRALLTPCLQRELGLVLFRPGSELLPLFMSGRVLISHEPDFLKSQPAGALVDSGQELAQDPALQKFFTDKRVIAAAGGIKSLEYWLAAQVLPCQWPDDKYHNPNMTSLRIGTGAVRLCWHHDHVLREAIEPELLEIANQNLAEWILALVQNAFMFTSDHQVTLPELCWWAALNNVIDAISDGPARRVLKLPAPEKILPVMKESTIRPHIDVTEILTEKAKPVLALVIDPEPPESFMLRPKPRRWVNENYTRWVKTQPCAGCGNQADDPHHITGHGMGGMGTKPHDFFTIPLCRKCHDELHRDTRAFEAEHGSQLEMLLHTQDRALALGVITTGKLK